EFNNKEQPWDNAKVRQAFATALDRKTFVEGVLQGVGIPATGWIPPGMPGYDMAIGKQYDFDPARARQLLSEAGYPEGQGLPKLPQTLGQNDTIQVIAEYLQDQFKKVLRVSVEVEMLGATAATSRFARAQYNFTDGSWTAAWPYPDNWLAGLFTSGAN